MKRIFVLCFVPMAIASFCPGCANTEDKKPVGPVTETSKIPWNSPIPGQGQGQFGMMQQNQYRR